MQGVWVQLLVRELRSHMPGDMVKKKFFLIQMGLINLKKSGGGTMKAFSTKFGALII